MIYEFMYRDGANYKTLLIGDVYRQLEVGQEITMEELGYTMENFIAEFVGSYDQEYDHNILEVVSENPTGKITFTAQQPIV